MRKKSLLWAVFLFATSIGVCVSTTVPAAAQLRIAFTLVLQTTDYAATGVGAAVSTETLYVSAGGNWHMVRLFANGKRFEYFKDERGIFLVNSVERKLIKVVTPPAEIIDHPNFKNVGKVSQWNRRELLLNYFADVYVQEGYEGAASEVYLIPEFGNLIVKLVQEIEGSKRVVEPISIRLGEPSSTLVRGPAFPVVEP